MKGRSVYTTAEIEELEKLIILRNNTESSGQKTIRDIMRKMGFYGRDDWGIIDLQLSDLNSLIKSGRLIVTSDGNKMATKIENTMLHYNKDLIKKDIPLHRSKDEHYVIDLCDNVLVQTASRQHKFNFLLGDTNSKGIAVKLPVDGYYEELKLVVEYHEKQHTEKTNIFDKPGIMTVSNVSRGEQRKIYDERRRQVLKKHNISLIEISYSDFNYDSQKRIIRNEKLDKVIIKQKMKVVLNRE